MSTSYVIYADGSCDPNPGPGSYAAILWDESLNDRTQITGGVKETTNNRMEYMAVLEALKIIPDDSAVTVYSDSQLLINTMTSWASNWESSGKMANKKNVDLVKALRVEETRLEFVRWIWVRGHSGDRWNERCDYLAGRANQLTKRSHVDSWGPIICAHC